MQLSVQAVERRTCANLILLGPPARTRQVIPLVPTEAEQYESRTWGAGNDRAERGRSSLRRIILFMRRSCLNPLVSDRSPKRSFQQASGCLDRDAIGDDSWLLRPDQAEPPRCTAIFSDWGDNPCIGPRQARGAPMSAACRLAEGLANSLWQIGGAAEGYSALRISAGSMPAARHAGRNEAAPVATTRTAVAAINEAASVGSMP